MKYCQHCGKELMDEAVVCTGCGYPINPAPAAPAPAVEEDKANVGLCVLAVIIPLFGFIYWPLTYNKTPKKAKACGICAVISFASRILLTIILTVVYTFLVIYMFDGMLEGMM